MAYKSLMTPPLKSWLCEFQPQAIYSMLGSYHIMRLCLDVSKEFGIALVPHFTDDWLSTIYRKCLCGTFLRKLVMRSLRELLDRAPIRFVISDAMGGEYARRYGGQYHTLLNCVDPERFGLSPQPVTNAPVRLLYLGGLHLDRWRSLRMLGAVLERLGTEGVHCELHIYTLPADVDSLAPVLDRPPWIRVVGWIPNDQVPELISKADILVHAEGFDKDVREYTKLSISTKIPEYLMSGRCVLGFGPSEVASMRYLKDSGGAVIVGRDDPDLLYSRVSELVRDGELRQCLGRAARAFALEHHTGMHQRTRFLRLMSESVTAFRGQCHV